MKNGINSKLKNKRKLKQIMLSRMSKKRKNPVNRAQNLTLASIVETLTGSTMPWVVYFLKNHLEKTTLISHSIINQSTIKTSPVSFMTNPSPLSQQHIRNRTSKIKAIWQSSLTITT